MSYTSEHLRMKSILDRARLLDIASNSDPLAVFEAGSAGFQVWCIPEDYPGGLWEQVAERMIAGAFSKPCAYVGSCYWHWEDEQITGLVISTDAYLLRDPRLVTGKELHNRPEDIHWLKQKIEWLWRISEVMWPMPPLIVEDEL